MDPVPGSVVGEKYRLDRPLARGGMGSVWAGRHLQLDVPIAVKFMSESASTSILRARFEREARAAASLRSPHVVQILDYGSADGSPFIVMELLEGEDLAQRIAHRGRLAIGEISAIVAHLAKGLTLAHEAGIVHRDLKPSNVFLARVGDDEIAKILDFGVAKETRLDASDVETTTGTVIGSPSYMSPEQARGGPIDARSDLWSLGVITFQALTGTRPFAGQNLGDVLVRICTDPLPVASSLAPDLPLDADAFFERALCRSPDGRYPDARSFAEALATVASGAPLDSAPRSAPAGRVERDRAPASQAPSPRTEATGSLAAAGGAPPERTAATVITPAALREETAAPLETSSSVRSRSRSAARGGGGRRGAAWALGGAMAVAAVWGGTQLASRGDGQGPLPRRDAATGTPAGEPVKMTAPSSPEPSVSPSPGEVPTAGPSASVGEAIAAGSATASATAVPTAPAAGAGAPRRQPERPAGPAGGKPAKAGEVDPKFGLPGAR